MKTNQDLNLFEVSPYISIYYPLPEELRLTFSNHGMLHIVAKNIMAKDILFLTYNTIIGNELNIILITHDPYFKEDKIILSKIDKNYKKYDYYISCKVKNFEEFKTLLSMRVEYFHIYSFNSSKTIEEDIIKYFFEYHEKHKIIFDKYDENLQGIRFIVDIYSGHDFIAIEGNIIDLIQIFESILINDKQMPNSEKFKQEYYLR